MAALAAARDGKRRLVLLGGEPGIGKTRLADEFATRASDGGAIVLWGRCWEEGGAPAYWPWIQVFRALLHRFDADMVSRWIGSTGAELAQMLPDVRSLLPDLPEPAGPPSDEARFRLFDAFDGFLSAVSLEQELVLVLEDIHAADVPSLLLLRFIAERGEGGKLLALATYRHIELTRDHPLAAMLPELDRATATTHITMKGLSRHDVGEFVRALTGSAPPQETISALHRGTEGNPLFVGELVRLLSAEDRRWSEVDPRRWPIPAGVREVIRRRVDRLSEGCRRALMFGAVVGRDFSIEMLERATGEQVETLLETLEDAVVMRLIAEVPASPGTFRFTHALMRDALYQDIMPSDRVRLHGTVGTSLEEMYAHDLTAHAAELAYHFFEAGPGGDTGKAARYAIDAGRRAVTMLAYEEAVRLFRMALHAMQDSPEADARCQVLLLLGDAERRAGDAPAARETFLQASAIATRLGAPQYLARAALGYAWHYPWVRAGVDARIIPLLHQALSALPEEDSTLRVTLLARFAGALRDQPSFEPRVSLAKTAVEMARRIGDPRTLAYALLAWWGASFEPDRLDEYDVLAQELEALSPELPREQTLFTHWVRVVAHMARGEAWGLRDRLEAAASLAGELRQASDRFFEALMYACSAVYDGRLDEADVLIEEMAERGRVAQGWDAGASRLLLLFAVRREQGRLDELEQELRRAPTLYPGYRTFRCALVTLLSASGRINEARGLFDRLAADDFAAFPRDNEYLSALTLLSETAVVLDDRDRAEVLYRLLLRYEDLIGVAGWEASTGPVARPLGLLAALLGRSADAARHLKHAIAIAERAEAKHWVAHCQTDYAKLIADQGPRDDRANAVALLAAASDVVDELGIVALKGPVAELQLRLGVRTGGRARAGADPKIASLTAREREVAGLIAEGLSNKQIAERLFVSERTAETHVQNILTKLAFSSRAQIAGWAVREGLGAGT